MVIRSPVTQGVPFTPTPTGAKVPVATKRPMGLSTSSTSMETGLEDMLLTEAPPLDLGSDSGEDPDDENSMYDTPSYPLASSLPSSTTSPLAPGPVSFTRPISILHNKPCTKSVAFSHPSFELDLETEPKYAKGLRPSVTFVLHELSRQEEQGTQQPSMAGLLDLSLLSIESNSSSHPHHDKEHPQALPSLLSIQLKEHAPSCSPSEAQGQSHADRLSCIENYIPQSVHSSAQHSSWVEPTHATIERGSTDSNESAPILTPQETLGHLLCPAPSEMLVALFDRPTELEALAAIHSDFFSLMYSSLPAGVRGAFKSLLFTSRDTLSDRDWMQAIAKRLDSLPCLLEKFKALVGWDFDDADVGHGWNDDDNEYDYEDSLEQVEIKWFRDLDGFSIEVFQKCYPQFFVNARDRLQGRRMSLGGDHRDRYVVFCETLRLSRQELACDNAWTRRMNACLEKHPELLLQFKEIVAYEVDYDN